MIRAVPIVFVTFAISFAIARITSAPHLEPEAGSQSSGAPDKLSALPDKLADDRSAGFLATVARMEEFESGMVAGRFDKLLASRAHRARSSEIISGWAASDPAGLWAWLQAGGREQLGNNRSPDYQLFRHWFQRDPAAAMETLRGADRRSKQDGAPGILALLFSDDATLAAEVKTHFEELARFDPEFRGLRLEPPFDSAIASVMALPVSPAQTRLVGKLAGAWFAADWKAAAGWAVTMPAADQREMEWLLTRQSLLHSVSFGSKPNPEQMEWIKGWLGKEENIDRRAQLGVRLIGQLGAIDQAAALQWAGENLGGATLAQAVENLVSAAAQKDIPSAIAMVQALPITGVRRQSAGVLAERWATKDAPAALAWALEQQAGGNGLSSDSWVRLGRTMAFHDPETTRQFITENEKPASDGFQRGALDNLARYHPETTVQWAKTLDGQRGQTNYQNALRVWKREGKEAANEWLENE